METKNKSSEYQYTYTTREATQNRSFDQSSSLVSRLTEYSSKLSSIEEKQQSLLMQQLDSQENEIKNLCQQFEQIQALKQTNEQKLLEVNQNFHSLIQSSLEGQTASPKIKKLAEENQRLMIKLTQLLDFKAAESPNSDKIKQLKETKRALKKQCNTAEEFIRNNSKFEREEDKVKIHNLQRNSSSLASELRKYKNEIQEVIQSQKTIRESDAFQNYLAICKEIEFATAKKDNEIKLLRETIKQKKTKLEKLNFIAEQIENEIQKTQESLHSFQI
ncbi:hypothetical protein GPJ56_001875 [Histomonas meleagridis]|uniref:uncharacterized protein n=1 Tax=Histomonas meleagridis TaxID=135588 RepID=UPI003559EC41|nr:hypothetical protein GPJ56_001875 [Histomonas meleagridis]KAH0803186.1 hypothetical protein GO595_003922 [Histomonas meleagridis]